jgi:aldose 1-epimerase
VPLTFSSDELEAVLLPEHGARLHRLRFQGQDLLRTPSELRAHEREPFFWGSYVMAPWANRLEGGPIRFGSRTIDLAPNFPDGSAIHGQVYARPWEPQADGTLRVEGGGEGWPWPYEVTQRVGVAGRSFEVDLELRNLGGEPMPAGLGLHPWFRRPLRIAVRADRVLTPNSDSPAYPVPVSGRHDLRRIGEPAPDLDATWIGLADPPVELAWPATGAQATMSIAPTDACVVAASPAALDAVAVEPQTHAPHGLRRLLHGEPGAMVPLDPGATLRLSMRLTFER